MGNGPIDGVCQYKRVATAIYVEDAHGQDLAPGCDERYDAADVRTMAVSQATRCPLPVRPVALRHR